MRKSLGYIGSMALATKFCLLEEKISFFLVIISFSIHYLIIFVIMQYYRM